MKKIMFKVIIFTLISSLLAGCSGSSSSGETEVLYLYNWAEYMKPEVLDKFEEETGIKVVESIFSSNDELLAKLLAGNNGEYDIAVPSNFYINSLKENDLLEPLNKDNIPNFENLDEAYLDLDYDKGNEYTVPYMGTICVWIADKVKLEELGVEIHTMADLTNEKLKDNIIMTDDPQGNIGMGMLGAGLDPTSNDPEDIEKGKEFLLSINENVKAYADSTNARDSMARGEAAVAYMYGGEALQAMQENPNLEIVMDGEPKSLSLDNFVILKGTEHKEAAEKFINFILRPDISAELTNEYKFVSFNEAAYSELSDELKNNPLCVLTDEFKENLFFINDVDNDAMTAEVNAMTEIKSAR